MTAHSYQVQTESVPVVTSIADSLFARIIALRPRLVVMGTHGKGWLQKMLFGSVAKSLLEKLSVPVLFDH